MNITHNLKKPLFNSETGTYELHFRFLKATTNVLNPYSNVHFSPHCPQLFSHDIHSSQQCPKPFSYNVHSSPQCPQPFSHNVHFFPKCPHPFSHQVHSSPQCAQLFSRSFQMSKAIQWNFKVFSYEYQFIDIGAAAWESDWLKFLNYFKFG